MKILVIEDDLETADHIGHALRAQGHEVDESLPGPMGWPRRAAVSTPP